MMKNELVELHKFNENSSRRAITREKDCVWWTLRLVEFQIRE